MNDNPEEWSREHPATKRMMDGITKEIPTPRTDALRESLMDTLWDDAYFEMRKHAETLERELTEAREELETERIRLAACGVVALADTESSREKAREMLPQYRSASLGDVERRVDECIRLRAELMEARSNFIRTLGQIHQAPTEIGLLRSHIAGLREQLAYAEKLERELTEGGPQ